MAKREVPTRLKGKGFDGKPENRNSLGIKGPRGSRSELRKLVNKLKEREELALDIIDRSLRGEEGFEKEQLQTSKWIVEKIISTTTAAISEEARKTAIKNSLKGDVEQLDSDLEEDTPKPQRFSLHMVNGGKKDEDAGS